MICRNCGSSNYENAQVCGFCGYPLQQNPFGSQPYGQNGLPYGQQAWQQPQPQQKKGPSTGASIGAVFLCIIACMAMIYLFFAGCTRYFLSGRGMATLMSETEMMDLLADGFMDSVLPMGLDEDVNDRMQAELKIVMGNMISDMVQYYITGKGQPFDVREIMDFVRKNADELERLGGVAITEEELEDFADYLEETREEIMEDYEWNMATMDEEEKIVFIILRGLISIWQVIIPAVVTVICLGAVALIFNPCYDRTMIYIGVTSIVSGACMLLFTGILHMVFGYVSVQSVGSSGFYGVVATISNMGYLIAAAVCVLGILLVVLGNVCRRTMAAQTA